MQYLKADTVTEVTVGPAVAVGDGFTPVTSLVGTSADEFELIKHGATATTTIAGTLAAITGADGYYALDLSATDTDTEGRLTLLINDDSLILPIRLEFMVVNANVFDSMFAAAGTDKLQVDLIEMGGVSQSATDLKDFADDGYDPATNKVQGVALADTVTNLTNLPAITANWLTAAGINANALDGKGDWSLASVVGALADAAAADEVTASDTVVAYLKQLINILVGTPGVVTLKAAAAPASGVSLSEMIRAIYDDTNSLDGTKIPDTISLANINTEVVDVVNTDTITLPGQVAPPLTPTHREAIAWLYKVLRNRKSQTATDWKLFSDDETTVDAKATVSDDGTTAIKQEIIIGP